MRAGNKIVIFFKDLSFGWLIDKEMFTVLTQQSQIENLFMNSDQDPTMTILE